MRWFPLLMVLCLMFCLVACTEPQDAPTSVSSAELTNDLLALTATYPDATVAIAIHDPVTGTRVDINGDTLLHAASTMKVPVMIEVFRQAEQGRFALDDSLAVINRFRSIVDGSEYSIEDDSDDAIYQTLGGPMSIRDLTYNMITVSSNLATNLLIDVLDADSVQATSEQLGTTRMRTLRGVEDIKAYRQGLSNRATANDLAVLMTHIMNGTAVSPEADRAMAMMLLDQQFTSMIPAQLPEDVSVAHKTGWITAIHHDAAIVYPPGADPYVLVIMTRGIPDETNSATLGAQIAATVHSTLRPTPADAATD